jgi:hypothetical protein
MPDLLDSGVNLALAISVRAGFKSTPIDLNPSFAQVAVVVPEPLHGSMTEVTPAKSPSRVFRTKASVYPP